MKKIVATLDKLALSHPLARWNKTITFAAAVAAALAAMYAGNQTVAAIAGVLGVYAGYSVPNAPAPAPAAGVSSNTTPPPAP